MMKKITLAAALLILSALMLYGESTWRGQAGVATTAGLPESGMYAATNEFPRGTVLEVRNLRNNKTLKLKVFKRSPSALDLNFIYLSLQAGRELDIRSGESVLVSVSVLESATVMGTNVDPQSPSLTAPEGNLKPLAKGILENRAGDPVEPGIEVVPPIEEPIHEPLVATSEDPGAVSEPPINLEVVELVPEASVVEKGPVSPESDVAVSTSTTPMPQIDLTPELSELNGPMDVPSLVLAEEPKTPASTLVVFPLSEPSLSDLLPESEPFVGPSMALEIREETPVAEVPTSETPEEDLHPLSVVIQPAPPKEEFPTVLLAPEAPVVTLAPVDDTTLVAESPKTTADPKVTDKPIALETPAILPVAQKIIPPLVPITPVATVEKAPRVLAPSSGSLVTLPRDNITSKVMESSRGDLYTNKPTLLLSDPLGDVKLISSLGKEGDYIQLGSFKNQEVLFKTLEKVNSYVPMVVWVPESPTPIYRLMVGPLRRDQLGLLFKHYQDQGFRDAVIIKRS